MSPVLKRARLVLWLFVAFVAAGATGLYLYSTVFGSRPVGLGHGDYELVTAAGETFNRQSLAGHPTVLFFGFTHCPDVCPTTLAEMQVWYDTLGSEARDLEAYFVSVDPERDTPEVIGDYVSWNPHVTAVTGSRPEVDEAIRAWGVYAQKVPLEGGGYNVDHTASVFLLDRDGEFHGTIGYGENIDSALAKLRRLIAGS